MVLAYERGTGPLDDVADASHLGRRTAARLIHKQRAGESPSPRPYCCGYPAALRARHLTLLGEQALEASDATLAVPAGCLKR
jgi:hypothetical protein